MKLKRTFDFKPSSIIEENPVVVALLVVGVVFFILHQFVIGANTFPEAWNFGLRALMDDFKQWIIVARTDDPVHPLFSLFLNPFSDSIEWVLDKLEAFLIGTPWVVVVLGIFFLTQRITTLRVTLLVTISVLAMGLLGLWEESMETLALMLFSVFVALLIGIPLGIWAGKSDRVNATLRPILDAMQTMPAFVYLIPVLLFFGIGAVPSMIATVIYAIPPVIRLTSLGIRGISREALEAAEAFGSTPRQSLLKVEIPMAMPTIMTGVNQTIMMALGIVVIASLIGFDGLGEVVLKALRRLRVGQAFEAGLAIVFLAILLDRVSYALSQIQRVSVERFQGNRLLPDKSWLRQGFPRLTQQMWMLTTGLGVFLVLLWLSGLWFKFHIALQVLVIVPVVIVGLHYAERPVEKLIEGMYQVGALFESAVVVICGVVPVAVWRRFLNSKSYWISVLVVLVILGGVCTGINEIGLSFLQEDGDSAQLTLVEFPEVFQITIRKPIDDAVRWMQINLYNINDSGIGTGPFSDFLTLRFVIPLRTLFEDTLPWSVTIVLFAALAYSVSGWRLAVASSILLFLLGGLGMWTHAMDTLSQVIVAVMLSLIIGIPLGVWAASSDVVERLLQPVLDFLQTIPPFVYLVPVIMLFNLGRIPGIIASVLYALPPIVRLTNLGIRQVNKAAVEAATAFGSTRWQLLSKVQLPLALPTIMLGVNQTIMMVLAMVIIAGLVGGGGLGFEVVAGLAQNELGRGVEAGLAIVLMAIVLDRITQAYAMRQAKKANIRF